MADAAWSCGSTAPGALADPAGLKGAAIDWLDAQVPGTAAGALRDAGRWTWGTEDEAQLDGRDWWWRCRFAGPEGGPWDLELDGLATHADVWLNGEHVLSSDGMFVGHRVEVDALAPENELAIRCLALAPRLRERRPRPRFKSRLVRSQALRWQRTTLLGRMPGWSRWAAPIGPWRPVRLVERQPWAVLERDLRVRCEASGAGGSVALRALVRVPAEAPTSSALVVGDERVPLAVEPGPEGTVRVSGSASLERVQRWWPHTHGDQPRTPARIELDDAVLALGPVAFRTVEADRSDGGFSLRINGEPVFCRGACWGPPDGVSLAAPDHSVRAAVERARDAGMNMLRVPGYGVYESPAFWEACDELGILVWQDVMIASVDPPDDEGFVAALAAELRDVFGALQARPSLAVVCGSSETYQQGSMYGGDEEMWRSSVLEDRIPAVLDELVGDLPYVPSSPSGGALPFSPSEGVAHYFGVGAYLRPAADARLAGVRFAAECLSFSTPPEPATVVEAFGGPEVAGHGPRWKQAVAYDNRAPWDFEDVRDHYVRELFGVDPLAVRYSDPERALDLGRAAICELMTIVLGDWRRRQSPCAGALVLTWQDLWPGAGWGLVDALGRAKAPLWCLRRVFASTALLLCDEGLDGLSLHVVHDGPEPLSGLVRVRLLDADAGEVEAVEREVAVEPRSELALSAEVVLGGFRDLNRAYRFAPPRHDVVVADLLAADGAPLAQSCHLVGGPARPRLPDLGMRATAAPDRAGGWLLTVECARFAQYVAVDAPGFDPADSWFHLVPGTPRTIRLEPEDAGAERRPAGSVRALNGPATRIAVEAAA